MWKVFRAMKDLSRSARRHFPRVCCPIPLPVEILFSCVPWTSDDAQTTQLWVGYQDSVNILKRDVNVEVDKVWWTTQLYRQQICKFE